MVVLSLFDGISCGQVALKNLGIKIDKYYASEIEQSSINVTMFNYPETIEVGNVCNVSYKNGILQTEKGEYEVEKIDLICAGSPCTNFSSIGYANGMTSGDTEIVTLEQYLELKNQEVSFDGQSYLFWEFVRILKEVKPQYFLLENVVMAKKWESIITANVGVTPIRINSSLLSAQNRPRLYWTNIPNIEVPKDNISLLSNILSPCADTKDVSYCQTVQRSFPRLIDKYGYIPERFNAYNASEIKEKACALSRGSMITSSCATLIFTRCTNGYHTVVNGIMDNIYPVQFQDGKYNIRKLSLLEQERLQTLPDNYTNVQGIPAQKRSEMIGNGWTVSVIQHIFSYMEVTNNDTQN